MTISGLVFFGFLLVFGSTLFYLKALVFLSIGYVFIGTLILQAIGDENKPEFVLPPELKCIPREMRWKQRREHELRQIQQYRTISMIEFGRDKERS
jgi:hypothetical protein